MICQQSEMASKAENRLIRLCQTKKKKRKAHYENIFLQWRNPAFLFMMVLIQMAFATAVAGSGSSGSSNLKVTPMATQLTALSGSNTSLACSASSKPILCLWKTPYGHVYTLSEGVFAESGRLRHEQPVDVGSDGCGLQIIGVESKDNGEWQCEVGGLVRDIFETNTATISLDVKKKSDTGFSEGHTSRQEVGNDVILHCSSDREVHLCRWKTPYLNTYIVGEGIYVERGRIQWLGKDPNFDCTIRVAKLDLRDAGTWVCEIGSSTTETFQVQTKEFVIDIETPLKLSAPTSLMQNANTDATLVCHANKPYDNCLWTTPYGATYSFSSTDVTHENGRIGFFGFASTDCGVIVRNVEARDNGDWMCQLHSRNGDIFQNATDVVPLFAASDAVNVAKSRALPDYDYDKKLSSQYDSDDYPDYSDFSKVGNEAAAAQQAPATKVQLFQDSSSKKFNDKQNSRPSSSTSTNSFQSTTTHRIQLSTDIELTKIPTTSRPSTKPSTSTEKLFSTTTGALFSTQRTTSGSSTTRPTSAATSTTPAAAPLSIFRDDGVQLSGVNALELELLSRISGTRRDSRPVPISTHGGQDQGDQDAVNFAVEFESSRTDVPTKVVVVDQATDKTVVPVTVSDPITTTPTADSRERMRLREIQRIRDERKKSAAQQKSKEEDEEEEDQRRKQERDEERKKKEEQEIKRRDEEEKKRKEEAEATRRKEALEKVERAREEERQRQIAAVIEEEKRQQREQERKKIEERQKQMEEQRRKEAEEEAKRKEQKEKEDKEREAERQRQINQARREEERRRQLELDRKIKAEKELEEKRRRDEEEKKRQKELEDQKRKEEEEARKKALELEEQRKREEEQKKKEEEERRQKELEIEEQKRKAAEEEKQRQKELEEKRQKELEEQRKKEEEEKKQKELEEQKKKEEEERKIKEQLEKERQERIEAEKKEEAERLKIEAEHKRQREEQRRRQQQLEEERKRRREEELRQRLEADRKKKLEEEKRAAELERKRQEERERARQEEEDRRKAEEEKLLKEIEQKKKEAEEREREEAAKKKKEDDERRRQREETARREEERKRRLEAQQKKEDEERAKRLEAERLEKLREEDERKKEFEKQRQEEMMKIQREEERKRAIERKREEDRQKELQQRKLESETKKFSDLENNRESTSSRPLETTTSLQPTSLSTTSASESPRSLQVTPPITNLLQEKGRENERKHCVLPAFPSNGNVTCGNLEPEGDEFRLVYGQSCLLTCRAGFVSLELRESRCFNGRMTQRLECVPPDALLIVGGRSDTYGVLSSVELVTGRGVCRGAVPPLPTMRWRMIAHAIDRERVLACGGVNIFGDPKTDCWIMGFNPEPFWSEAASMTIARDAAAWAQEGNFLFVLGGSLGKFSGFTDSVEMFSVESGRWLEGPKMSSSRYSHCAVGLGNGSLIVTGGYGGLNMVERLDVATGQWVQLPELNPVRAQHGCAIVDLHGEHGIIVVGGDSGGTRLKDVRFLPLGSSHTEWKKVADMLTARWGRPGVGIVGGRITVAAGWNGVKDLDTIEYYDEVKREWRRQASRLQTERRWPSSTPISLFLFPKCAQRRE